MIMQHRTLTSYNAQQPVSILESTPLLLFAIHRFKNSPLFGIPLIVFDFLLDALVILWSGRWMSLSLIPQHSGRSLDLTVHNIGKMCLDHTSAAKTATVRYPPAHGVSCRGVCYLGHKTCIRCHTGPKILHLFSRYLQSPSSVGQHSEKLTRTASITSSMYIHAVKSVQHFIVCLRMF